MMCCSQWQRSARGAGGYMCCAHRSLMGIPSNEVFSTDWRRSAFPCQVAAGQRPERCVAAESVGPAIDDRFCPRNRFRSRGDPHVIGLLRHPGRARGSCQAAGRVAGRRATASRDRRRCSRSYVPAASDPGVALVPGGRRHEDPRRRHPDLAGHRLPLPTRRHRRARRPSTKQPRQVRRNRVDVRLEPE